MTRTPLTLLATACLLAAALPAHAVGNLVDVRIVDRTTGETLAPVLHDGQWWVAGRPGAKYRVALVNRDGRRTLNVVSIDGVNAISGDTASWDQTGYVIDPRQRTEIDGWRKNMSQVAAFEFAALPDSYAARTGRPTNVGVIGVAIFGERLRIAPAQAARALDESTSDASRRAAPSAPAPASEPPSADAASARTAKSLAAQSMDSKSMTTQSMADSAPRERLGTAHGEIEQSSIRYVFFQRAQSTPNEIVTIHYDRMENLIAMGIVPPPLPAVAQAPVVDPFPGSRRFVPDPPPR